MKRLLYLILTFTLLFSVLGGIGASAKDNNKLSKEEEIQQDTKNMESSNEIFKINSGKSSQKSLIMNSIDATASDTIPVLESADPYRWQENVPRNKVIRLGFSTLIQYGNKKIRVWDTDTYDDFPIRTEIQGSYLLITPIGNFDPFKKYMISIDNGAVSSLSGYGNANFFYSFNTNNVLSPLAEKVDPSFGQDNVPVDKVIKVIFDKSIKSIDKSKILLLGDSSKTIPATVTTSGSTVQIKPNSVLNKNTVYGFGLEEGAIYDTNGIPNQRIISVFMTGSSSGGGTDPGNPDDGDNEDYDLSVTVEYKKTAKIKIQGGKSPYTVTSSNSSVATATIKSNYITISGKKKGEATITVKDKNGEELTIDVNVIDYIVNF
ncbi:Ig-like domain-containing protein [Brevibacillus choshinensis]|uniref:Ig-like domain-containing protein n=1 Tax=Brevibacillus choshinensis TaxID=54911 RepID=UPI002E1A15C4|nr:Ig-like domain-containing protein [Brevibacillus choshinensis]